jgi:hypothetical protein
MDFLGGSPSSATQDPRPPPGAMVVLELLLSLGMLLTSAPGLGGRIGLPEAGPPLPAGSGSHALLQTGPPHGSSSPASREETSMSDPGEEEEFDHRSVLGTSYVRVGAIPGGDRNPPAGPHGWWRGFLLQLHHSWQLVC